MRFLDFFNHEKGAPRQEVACSIIFLKLAANGLQRVSEKWVGPVRSASLAKGVTSKKNVTIPPQRSNSE
jgi:hypothetical protein